MISENFHKYEEKLEQMRAVVPFLESNQTQCDLKNRFGKLTTPDMMSYIALNGDLRKIFGQKSNYSESKFQEWKSKNFEGNGVLERFEDDYREDFRIIAKEISHVQHLIVRPFFSKKFRKILMKNRHFMRFMSEICRSILRLMSSRSTSKNAMKPLLALFFSLHPKCRKNWKKSTQKNPHNNAVFS